jgi:hypothetical protein
VPREGAAGALRGRAVSPNVGGDARSSPDWSAVPATAAGAQAASKTEFTHVMLALPTVGWSHDDVVPVCVVDTLLGGGSSFSAGGPGKGMYSRLYREVLNMHSWVESANAFSTQASLGSGKRGGAWGDRGARGQRRVGPVAVSTHSLRLSAPSLTRPSYAPACAPSTPLPRARSSTTAASWACTAPRRPSTPAS